jgi:hypothetical protein
MIRIFQIALATSMLLSVTYAAAKTEKVAEQVLVLSCTGTSTAVIESRAGVHTSKPTKVETVYVLKKQPINKAPDRWKISLNGSSDYESLSAEADKTIDNHKGDHRLVVTDELVTFEGSYSAGPLQNIPTYGDDAYKLRINRATGGWTEDLFNNVNWSEGTRIRVKSSKVGSCKETKKQPDAR